MNIGYARVSTEQQNLNRQLDALKAAGCERIYSDKASGKSLKDRPELRKAIDGLRAGDCLVVAEWDRATRSMNDGIDLLREIASRGATVRVLDKPFLDLTTPIGLGLLSLLSSLAQDERERIVRRSKDGLAAARKRGVKMGRRHKLNTDQRSAALAMLTQGKSMREVARVFMVDASTICRL